ncbi:cyclic nucleotide-binding domain-containing protein 2-like [Lingula anatina]|uniref:Cyclic nucleotide-binding domain-containing protein 2-like n=1 Tax=Lingula anatina TaxID=7574 RepID=A0A2R2MPY8_LINAN|nr:cyclic nucleotide-binding domain-containing protein 2-like [Lingula anatina]|eukprot:XP_023932306.1 cyclic nucleotide-binding domain-containing protein 2-like [Lingula anatina]
MLLSTCVHSESNCKIDGVKRNVAFKGDAAMEEKGAGKIKTMKITNRSRSAPVKRAASGKEEKGGNSSNPKLCWQKKRKDPFENVPTSLEIAADEFSSARSPGLSATKLLTRVNHMLPSDLIRIGANVKSRWREKWKEEKKRQRRELREKQLNALKPKRDGKTPLQRFRRAARIVKMLCAVNIALSRYALDAGLDLSAFRSNFSTRRKVQRDEDGAEVVEELNFDPDEFKSHYEFTWPESARLILEKKPWERTDDDIYQILRLMRTLSSFRKYTHEMQTLMAKTVRYAKYGRHRVILRKGHIGFSFYFIFSGSASVTLEQAGTSIFSRPVVIRMQKGDCFGEKALVKDVPRLATVVVEEDIECIVLDKGEFIEHGLLEHMEKEMAITADFLKNSELFTGWKPCAVEELSQYCMVVEHLHDRVVVKDARENEFLLFVTKGSCDVLKLVDLARCRQFQKLVYGNAMPLQETPVTLVSTPSEPTMYDILLETPTASGIYIPTIQQPNESHTSLRSRGSLTSASLTTPSLMKRPHPTSLSDRPQLCLLPRLSECKDLSQHSGLRPPPETSSASRSVRHLAAQESQRDSGFTSAPPGVFLRVDTLKPGDYFGLESLTKPTCHVSVVSKGTTVILVPKTKFLELANPKTLQKLQKIEHVYPSDDELCRKFLAINEWQNYKHKLMIYLLQQMHRAKTRNLMRETTPDLTESSVGETITTTPWAEGSGRRMSRSSAWSRNSDAISTPTSDKKQYSRLTTPAPRLHRHSKSAGGTLQSLRSQGQGEGQMRPPSKSRAKTCGLYRVEKSNVFAQGSEDKLQLINKIHVPLNMKRLAKSAR